jgi:putative membrane protein insertion efficiency factor
VVISGKKIIIPVCITTVITAAFAFDAVRPPQRQLLVKASVKVIEGYRNLVKPRIRGYIHCKFEPPCSEYACRALSKYGFWKGALLSIKRLARCSPLTPTYPSAIKDYP